MKLRLIKWIIAWLMRAHFRLLYEAVVPDGSHLHHNPRKKDKELTDTTMSHKYMEGHFNG